MNEKIRRNIHIEILEYAQKHTEFIISQLTKDLNFNQNERNLIYGRLVYESLLFNTGRNQKTNSGEESIYTISTEGRFKLLEYEQLENANKSSEIAVNKATTSIKWTARSTLLTFFALIIAIITLICNIRALNKTQQSLELSTNPVITIDSAEIKGNSLDLKLPGHILTTNLKANLILKNNFLGDITNIDLRMVLLEMSVDSKSKNLIICPAGHIDYTSNPQFIIREDLQVGSILDNKKFNLKPREEYNFSVDYKNIENATRASSSVYFIKIDVTYKREIDNRQFNFSKIYRVLKLTTLSGENKGFTENFLVDTDIDKETIMYNDKNNEILSDTSFAFPLFLVFPFREKDFVDVIKSNIVPPYSLQPSECEYFKLDKKINLIE